jgi:hypothetical protein
MSIEKPKEQSRLPVNEVKEQSEYITNAIIKPMNIFDVKTGMYTTEINQKTVKVETFVNDLKTEKPVLIGYIQVSTIEKFLDGTAKVIPIKIRRM